MSNLGTGAVIVKMPDVAGFYRQFFAALEPKKAQKIYMKGLTAAGKSLVKTARLLAPGPGKTRMPKGSNKLRKAYGRTGALRKSLKYYLRKGKKSQSPYVVVGANRDTKIASHRGKQNAYSVPANYIHLVEKGFTAVARVKISGQQVQGRDVHYNILNQLRRVNSSGRTLAFRAALEKGLDAKLLTGNHLNQSKIKKETVIGYIAGYKAATKTKVPGRFFMKRAQRDGASEAIDLAKTIMIDEYEKLISVYRVKT